MNISKIYFDMDGVLADFDQGVVDMLGLPYPNLYHETVENSDRMWHAIREYDHFYYNLAPREGAVELFRIVHDRYGDQCQILTGIPKPRRNIPEAGPDKIEWARKYLCPDVIVNVVLREEKINFCKGLDHVLIDDFRHNTDAWRYHGGLAVDHVDAERTLQELKNLNIL
ncbi:MAG: hypothetical protein IKS32_13290 [Solobacterium sp.]|nr:hypothetical protein [Solobacterium sp.]